MTSRNLVNRPTQILCSSFPCFISVNLKGKHACLEIMGAIPASDEPQKLRLTTWSLWIRAINNGGLPLRSTITVSLYEVGYNNTHVIIYIVVSGRVL